MALARPAMVAFMLLQPPMTLSATALLRRYDTTAAVKCLCCCITTSSLLLPIERCSLADNECVQGQLKLQCSTELDQVNPHLC